METKVSSTNREVIIGYDRPTALIGERINPTGKKKLAAALQAGNLELVRQEALAQVEAGADILDVNVGSADIDEVSLLPQVVQVVMDTVDVPLCLDSTNPQALELGQQRSHARGSQDRPGQANRELGQWRGELA